ncbi:metalloprotease 1 [Colletotrichum tofieldiae]|uniref:Metalloprotease 1 n=1 Tax=Colletotrichum tofieldiae TaxID=708197 RepID=A0A166WQR9_9PEZI|nr:metalloprotease 1 [Colletotrichum tofieldiae]GKT62531.1 metalloprotease 1 [Colletotrichum tofieldiae]GKT69423.1 metalloprotease 1 [Colletotrichum tofieldiae]GKT96274.1 metalloprotease 1 [Colletotrichum tofieldiae]
MLLNSILFATLVAAGVSRLISGRNQKIDRCGTTQVSQNFAKTVSQLEPLESIKRLSARSSNSSSANLPIINVKVYVHTVSSEAKRDYISDESIDKQFELLRNVYADYDINIQRDETIASRTVDDFLATGQWPLTNEQVVAKREFFTKTRKGSYDAINLYYYTDMTKDFWGSCTIPQDNVTRSFDDVNFREDGCSINADSLPDGPFEQVGLGYTTIHEVGHWFGLLHVFQGYSCEGVGDFVDDTPTTQVDTKGCPVGKDSCPDVPGLDPIHNYMDYSDDSCFNEFTEGQKLRMHSMWETLRLAAKESS